VCDCARNARRERRRRSFIVSLICVDWGLIVPEDSQLGEHAVGGGAEAASDGDWDPLLRESHSYLCEVEGVGQGAIWLEMGWYIRGTHAGISIGEPSKSFRISDHALHSFHTDDLGSMESCRIWLRFSM
jgi:hypothetical protein